MKTNLSVDILKEIIALSQKMIEWTTEIENPELV
jgi:hypothetical protein